MPKDIILAHCIELYNEKLEMGSLMVGVLLRLFKFTSELKARMTDYTTLAKCMLFCGF